MAALSIVATSAGRPLDPGDAQRFVLDLEREVGSVRTAATPAAGAKGSLPDLAAIAVAVLSAPAIVALVGLLKSYSERDRGFEVEVEGPGGKVRIKGADARRLGTLDLAALIRQALGADTEETSGAPGSAGRV